MHKKGPCLNPLELQKQLLVAESDLNRGQMVGDMAALGEAARNFSVRIKTFGSLSASAAMLVAGFTAFQRARSTTAASKPSGLQTLLKGAGLISTLWLAFRSRGGNPKNVGG